MNLNYLKLIYVPETMMPFCPILVSFNGTWVSGHIVYIYSLVSTLVWQHGCPLMFYSHFLLMFLLLSSGLQVSS